MKRRELEKVMEKHGRHIEKYSKHIPGSFGEEDIHELRVEYKKLRAFIRLVKLDKKAGRIKMPARLKSLYHAAGKVRDLHLFIQQLTDPSKNNTSTVPHYIKYLRHDLFEAKEQLVKEIERADFDKFLKDITDELPAELGDDTVKKFIHRKVATIQIILLAVETEKELHTIRKQLKDIIYDIKIFQNDWGISFPVIAWKSEKLLNDMTTKLGNFNDLCATLGFLKPFTHHEIPPEEREYIETKRQEIQQQLEQEKHVLLEQVQHLHLNSNF